MQLTALSKYQKAFAGLKVDRSKGFPAPHKPVLLLAVIASIESGEIRSNRIYITPELVARFRDTWHQLVHTNSLPKFELPFYHLKTSKFWKLIMHPGMEIILTRSFSIKSFLQLRRSVAYAEIDEALWLLLRDTGYRNILRNVLLQTRFGLGHWPNAIKQPGLFDMVAHQILCESAVTYRTAINPLDEEEIFVRGGVFKKVVPRIYHNTCAITGMRINATLDAQMIDACHIVPFSISHDDTITNGISLCPNLHRAFDRFLITISSDFRLVVSDSFTESASNNSAEKKSCFPTKGNIIPRRKTFHGTEPNTKNYIEQGLSKNRLPLTLSQSRPLPFRQNAH